MAALIYWEPLHARAAALFDAEIIAARYPILHGLILHKYYVDEIYDILVVNPVKRLCQYCFSFDLGIIDGLVNGAGWLARLTAWLSHKMDIYLVDGAVNSLATLVDYGGSVWRRLQTGYLQNYVLIFVLGLILVVGSMMLLP
jgi:NADH-quinone oxidoreductase subunit L